MTTDAGKQDEEGSPRKQGRRGSRVLLVVSLALNLLFVGLIAGALWARWHGGAPKHRVYSGAVEQLMPDLQQSQRQNARALLKTYEAKIGPLLQRQAGVRRQARDAIKAEPYNEQRTEDVLRELRDIRGELHLAMHEMVLGMLQDLRPEQRRKFLSIVRARFRQRASLSRRLGYSDK